ncbi:MAG: hypothetical protein JOY96_07405 [Verrucomicrobia bacterium]|nr:hypothetical protein [Verrucomicrobiota bacterium]
MRAVVILFLASGILFAGCKAGKPDPRVAANAAVSAGTGEDFKVTARNDVKFYQGGPQQITLPDAFLKKGTMVRTVKRQLGFTLVEMPETKKMGWIATEDLAALPPQPAATPYPAWLNPANPGQPPTANPAIIGTYKLQDPNNLTPVPQGATPVPRGAGGASPAFKRAAPSSSITPEPQNIPGPEATSPAPPAASRPLSPSTAPVPSPEATP